MVGWEWERVSTSGKTFKLTLENKDEVDRPENWGWLE